MAGRRECLAVAAGAFVLVAAVAGGDGGYFPTAWGWLVVAFVWVAGLVLILRARVTLSRLELAALGSLTLLVAWTALSISWSEDVPQSVLEVERSLVYLTALLAALLVLRRLAVPHLAGGLLAGITGVCVWALLTRFFPEGSGVEEIETNRLSDPIGYANALGLFAAMGVLIALGSAARHRSALARAGAAAALPVLLTAQYLTFSRGAWAALTLGLIAAVALDPRRLQLLATGLVLAPLSAVALFAADSSDALTGFSASHDAIRDDGTRLALILLALGVASAAVAWTMARAEERIAVAKRVRQAFGTALAVAAAAAVVIVVVASGGPREMVSDAWDTFEKDQPLATNDSGSRQSERLFWLGSNARLDYWDVSWRAQEEHPWRGTGAGSFEQRWLEERTITRKVRDAHGLYPEIVGELGWIGLALLLGALVPPLIAAAGARRDPLMPIFVAPYVAFLAHAGVDWQWEMPAVTLIAFACAAALLVAARPRDEGLVWPAFARFGVLALAIGIAGFSVVGLVGNRALADASDAADQGRWEEAEDEANTAIDWAPWSGEAWQHLGRAQLGRGQVEEARESLREAARKDPGDWRIWYDLGVASKGSARRRAYTRAARLNPLAPDIEQLRDSGFRLPPAPEITSEP